MTEISRAKGHCRCLDRYSLWSDRVFQPITPSISTESAAEHLTCREETKRQDATRATTCRSVGPTAGSPNIGDNVEDDRLGNIRTLNTECGNIANAPVLPVLTLRCSRPRRNA